MTIGLLLLLLALVCFVLATFGVTLGTINLVAAGLAFWVLSLLVGSLEGLGSSTLLIVLIVIVVAVLVIVLVQRGTFTRGGPPAK
jgi:hypothetical protein